MRAASVRAGLAALGMAAWAAHAQEAQPADAGPSLEGSGEGITAAIVTPESLAAFPAIEQDVTFQTSNGERRGVYEGVLLWPVLQAAGLLEGIERNAELRRTFAVIGSDGYEVDFSVGEIHPEFGNTPR